MQVPRKPWEGGRAAQPAVQGCSATARAPRRSWRRAGLSVAVIARAVRLERETGGCEMGSLSRRRRLTGPPKRATELRPWSERASSAWGAVVARSM